MEVIGGRWRAAVLWKVLRGEACRYGELGRAIPGISPKMLAQELRALGGLGVLERCVPPLDGYAATALGRSLEQALTTLWTWGEASAEGTGRLPANPR